MGELRAIWEACDKMDKTSGMELSQFLGASH
jgi:hypothetical protein